MIIDGVKMACEACIRGHRVSGCNHHDRKLLPIAKKGRPVSQCNHCRSMRKSRAAHVKCDCGEKYAAQKEQLKNGSKPTPLSIGGDGKVVGGAPRGGAGVGCGGGGGGGGSHTGVAVVAPLSDDSKSVSPPCPCCHGGHCTCALKKEPQHLDAVPEFDEPPPAPGVPAPEVRTKPRLQMTHSESSLIAFSNGHHKPSHKHHSSIHGSSPYSIPTIGHSGHTFGEHSGCTKMQSASLPPSAQKSRRIKSEQSSPDLRSYPALQMATTGITPLELTPRLQPSKPAINRSATGHGLSLNTNQQTFPNMREFQSPELLPSADSESSYLCSAGLYPPHSAGWPPSFAPYDSTSYEDATAEFENFLRVNGPPPTSTTGDERDDLVGFGGPSPPAYGFGTDAISSSSSDQADSDHYHLSAASSYATLPQVAAEMPALRNGSFDTSDFNRLMLVPSEMPVTGIDSFQAGLVVGSDPLYDGDLGLGAFGSPVSYTESALSIVSKGMDSGVLVPAASPIPPPPEDDGLWMASWNNNGL